MESVVIGLAVTCVCIVLIVSLSRKSKYIPATPVKPPPHNLPATPTHGCAQGLRTPSGSVCKADGGQVCKDGFVQNLHTDCSNAKSEASCNDVHCKWTGACVPIGPTCEPSGCKYGVDYLNEQRTLHVCNQGCTGSPCNNCLDGFTWTGYDQECKGKPKEDCTGMCAWYDEPHMPYCVSVGATCEPSTA